MLRVSALPMFWGNCKSMFCFQQRAGDDEDDQQHERQVQQRRDVDFAQRHQRIALGKALSFFLQIFRFHLRNQVLREIVQLDRPDAQGMHQPIIGEHGRNGHQQTGHGGDHAAETPGAIVGKSALPAWPPGKVSMTPQTVPSNR